MTAKRKKLLKVFLWLGLASMVPGALACSIFVYSYVGLVIAG